MVVSLGFHQDSLKKINDNNKKKFVPNIIKNSFFHHQPSVWQRGPWKIILFFLQIQSNCISSVFFYSFIPKQIQFTKLVWLNEKNEKIEKKPYQLKKTINENNVQCVCVCVWCVRVLDKDRDKQKKGKFENWIQPVFCQYMNNWMAKLHSSIIKEKFNFLRHFLCYVCIGYLGCAFGRTITKQWNNNSKEKFQVQSSKIIHSQLT